MVIQMIYTPNFYIDIFDNTKVKVLKNSFNMKENTKPTLA